MEENVTMSTGALLRSIREQKGLLLREIGAKLSVDPALVSKIERNERLPTREQIKAFCRLHRNHREAIMVAWLSDKLVDNLRDEKLAFLAMEVAESKLKYGYE